jgi:hypothetical protein
VCAFFHNRDEEYGVLLPFIKEGLERGEKAFHVVSPADSEHHLDRLARGGIDVQNTIRGGQLELHDWEHHYLPDGRFDQDRTLAGWTDVLARSERDGYPQTRVVAHMEWALEDRDGVKDLLEYEARFNLSNANSHPVICVYDVSRFGGDVIIDIMRTHPMVLIGGTLHQNPFYVPPQQFVAELRRRHTKSQGHVHEYRERAADGRQRASSLSQ